MSRKMTTPNKNQKIKILRYLAKGCALTATEALPAWGCARLAARIYDLKKDGHDIKSEFVTAPSGKKVKSYWLA